MDNVSGVASIELHRADGSVAGVAIVDLADLASVAPWPWHLTSNGYVRHASRDGHGYVFLHRFLMGCQPGDGQFVDHINRNRLDNRRTNLRIVTVAQNQQNVSVKAGKVYPRGVSFNTRQSVWRARAELDGREFWLGRYSTEAEAVAAVRAWRSVHMPFASDEE